MKKERARATALQFEQALLEQINHARSMNVPVNAVSSAAMFTLLVGDRLYGSRQANQRTTEFNDTLAKLVSDARDERARERAEAQRAQAQQTLNKPRVILPD